MYLAAGASRACRRPVRPAERQRSASQPEGSERAPGRTAGGGQQRAYALELAQFCGILEPFAAVFVGSGGIVGNTPRLDVFKRMPLEQVHIFGFGARMHRDIQLVYPPQRVRIVLVKVNQDEKA